MFTVYGSLMALMVYGNDGVEHHEYSTGKSNGKSNGKSSAARQRKAEATYILRRSNGRVGVRQQGSHASPNGVFTVRGHWRHYKSGKEVWIAEYRKGCGKKKNKTYKAGFEKEAE